MVIALRSESAPVLLVNCGGVGAKGHFDGRNHDARPPVIGPTIDPNRLTT